MNASSWYLLHKSDKFRLSLGKRGKRCDPQGNAHQDREKASDPASHLRGIISPTGALGQGYFILKSQRINFLSDSLSPFKRTLTLSQEIHFLVHYGKNEIALYFYWKSIPKRNTLKVFVVSVFERIAI